MNRTLIVWTYFGVTDHRVCLLRRGVSILSDNRLQGLGAEEENKIRESADECISGGLIASQPITECIGVVWK